MGPSIPNSKAQSFTSLELLSTQTRGEMMILFLFDQGDLTSV